MKRFMAVFAALILLVLCMNAQAEGFRVQFDETWINACFLGADAAWLLDRDGNLLRWDYGQSAPQQAGTLPVATREMFEDYDRPYADLSAQHRAEIDATVSLLAEDEGVLYALNLYAGSIGTVSGEGVQWQGSFDASPYQLPSGETAGVSGVLVAQHRICILLNRWEQAENLILEIDPVSGQSQALPAAGAYRMAADGQRLWLVCVDQRDRATLCSLDLASGQLSELPVALPAREALACDCETHTLYVADASGIYTSRDGAPFTMAAEVPTWYLFGEGAFTAGGQYVYTSGGVWVFEPSTAEAASTADDGQLRLRVHSSDPTLRAMFLTAHPGARLDWVVEEELTAAEIGNALRGGDDTTDIFSLEVDSAFGQLVRGQYASPFTNEDLLRSVNDMYPALANCLRDAQGQVVACPWSVDVHGMWGVNDSLWRQYFGEAACPATWKDFFACMLAFEEMDNGEGDLFLMDWDAAWMLREVLTAFIVRQEWAGAAVNFTDPALLDTLNALEQVRQALRSRGVETYSEEEVFWMNESVGDHSLFHPELAYSSHSARMGMENTLPPFTFSADETPVYQGGMRVLVVSPLSRRKALAEDFISLLTQPSYNPIHWYLLHTSAAEAFDQKPWRISTDDIAAWQATLNATYFSHQSTLLSTAFFDQITPLLARYLDGQLDLQTLLQKLNDTARMIEAELR